jgi:hypothetical protein
MFISLVTLFFLILRIVLQLHALVSRFPYVHFIWRCPLDFRCSIFWCYYVSLLLLSYYLRSLLLYVLFFVTWYRGASFVWP